MPGKQPRMTKKEKKAYMQVLCNIANAVPDLLANLQKWTVFKKHGLDLKIESKSSADVGPVEIYELFSLLKANMEVLYENTDWGWKDDAKLSELTHKDARFLIVRDNSNNQKIVGFSHFRFDVEQNLPILYCYELQIDDAYQRKGIGRHMMNILSLLAYEYKFVKIVLTVFKNNLVGINFYMNSLMFKKDSTCPFAEEGKCYMILRKSIDKAEINAITAV